MKKDGRTPEQEASSEADNDDVLVITSKWDEVLVNIEELEIGLEADDITISEGRVVWIKKA